jgi:hypothetical protein
MTSCEIVDKLTQKDEKKHYELEKIEILVRGAIIEGDKKKAFDLVSQLVHPSSEQMVSDSKLKKSDIWNGNSYYTYDEWWGIKRDSLMKVIEKMPNNKIQDVQKKEPVLVMDDNSKNTKKNEPGVVKENTTQQNTNIESKTNKKLENVFVGLYLNQKSDVTQFFKIIKKSDEIFSVIYQDNIGGTLKNLSFSVLNYDKLSGKILLREKNMGTSDYIIIKQDTQSKNGYSLTDSKGIIYRQN